MLPAVYGVDVDPCAAGTRIRAAWLWAGDGAVVTGAAAARWLGLTTAMPPVIELAAPPPRGSTRADGVVVGRVIIPPEEQQWNDGIVVTSAVRTCLDLARQGKANHLETALRTGRLRVQQLPASLEWSEHRWGQRRARAAVEAVADNPWSYAERIAHQLLRGAGITGWVANKPTPVLGGVVYPDISFEEIKLAIEIDGRLHHDEAKDSEAFERDHARQLALALAGWFVIRVTVRQLLDEPAVVIATIRRVVDRLSKR